MRMIQLENVSRIYERKEKAVRALDDVSLLVERNEFVAVVGPSGSGKSTLLLTIGGMIRPTSGEVLVGGRNIYALSERRRAAFRGRKIGFVFQMFHLLPYLDVLENVLVAGLASGNKEKKKALELVERVNLSPRMHHRPSELSTGERQRVALARAFFNSPEIILADEPTGNLDPGNATEVMKHLAEFHRDGGTVLLVTHEAFAGGYAQRTIHLDQGKLVRMGK